MTEVRGAGVARVLSGRLGRLFALGPLLFYGYIYFGLRWLEEDFVAVLKHPVGLIVIVVMSGAFVSKALKVRFFPLRLIFVALGLVLIGIFLSVTTRQSDSVVLREGQSGRVALTGKRLALRGVRVADYPVVLLNRDQVADVLIDGRPLRFGVLPTRVGVTFYHTVRFGFSPDMRVFDENGRPGPWLNLDFGLNPIDEQFNKLVPRRPPPRVMLSVGTYPPETETLFEGDSRKVYFLRIEKGAFAGRVRDLMRPDYYLWLTNGRLSQPKYRLMVWRDSKPVFNRTLTTGQPVNVDGRVFELGALKYWVEIGVIKDYGLPLVQTALILLASGILLTPIWIIIRLARRMLALVSRGAI